MTTIEFPSIKFKKNFPESLKECDSREYIAMSKFIYLYQTKQITIEQFQTLSVYSLLNVIVSKKKKPKNEEKHFENIALISELVMNFFDFEIVDDTQIMTVKLDFIHNPIKSFKLNGFTFLGPSDNFESVTFGQYLDGLTLFLDFAKHQEYSTLIQLLNIFYKPKWPWIEKRIIPNKNNIDVGIVFGFYLYFTSFQKFITGAKIEVGGTEIDLSVIFQEGDDKSTRKSSLPGLGMKSLLFSLSESGVFGTQEEVRKTSLWEVLLRLYDIRKNALDEKAEYDRLKK